jgi:hypothetical protein
LVALLQREFRETASSRLFLEKSSSNSGGGWSLRIHDLHSAAHRNPLTKFQQVGICWWLKGGQ